MKLYGYFRSSATYRTRIALNIKGIAYETALVDLRAPTSAQHAPQFVAVNPHGLVPVLEDGVHTLTQSLAIIEYLEETHPEPPLLPRAPAERAQVRALALAVACDIHPLNNLRVLELPARRRLATDDAAVNAWYAHWIARGFSGARARTRERLSGDGRHMFGTHGDARGCLSGAADGQRAALQVRRRALSARCAPSARTCEALPAFARAAPQAQPDAQKPLRITASAACAAGTST